MQRSQVDAILTDLLQLNEAQLNRVRLAAEKLLKIRKKGREASNPKPENTNEALLYAALAEALNAALGMGQGGYPTSYALFRTKQDLMDDFLRGFDVVEEILQAAAAGEVVQRPIRIRMYQLLCTLVIREVTNSVNCPLNLKSCIRGLGGLPYLVNSAFPGYMQAGVLFMIAKKDVLHLI